MTTANSATSVSQAAKPAVAVRRRYVPAVTPRLKKLLFVVFALFALLGANSMYLVSVTALEWFTKQTYQDFFYQLMFGLHLVMGAAIILPVVIFGALHIRNAHNRPNRRAVRVGYVLFAAALLLLATGLVLTRIENVLEIKDATVRRVAYWLHVTLPLVCIWLFVIHRLAGPKIKWKVGAGWLGVAAAFAIGMVVVQAQDPRRWNVAGPKSDDPAKNGCPPADADKDGIADDADACPLTPGVRTDDAKANGCPADGDQDGVPDLLDACPKEPGVRTDDAKTSGCPAAKPPADSDNDGVADDKDACPNEPGKPDADAQKNGCPKAFLKNDEIKITEQVKFEKASAKISQGAPNDEVLGAVLDVLKAHPEVAMLRVEGHTDNAGNAVANERLSTRRAEAVVAWLVAHGISKSQLTAKGLGANKPIDSNDTDSGRANNRRVEFHVEKGAPAGAAEKKGGEK